MSERQITKADLEVLRRGLSLQHAKEINKLKEDIMRLSQNVRRNKTLSNDSRLSDETIPLHTHPQYLTGTPDASDIELDEFHNGSFKEPFDFVITEAGGVVTGSLDDTAGAGSLTAIFSSGQAILDVSSPRTIVLTAEVGTDASPNKRYVYILESDSQTLVVASAWPATEFIAISTCSLPSATFIGNNGPYENQNHNNMVKGTNDTGMKSHMGDKLRSLGPSYISGIAGNGTDGYLTPAAGNVEFISTAGVVKQLHDQAFPVFTTVANDVVLVKNFSGEAYKDITNLYDITADSGGNAIGNNKYFNLVVFAVVNKSGTYMPMIINLPAGFYAKSANATNDVDNHDDYVIPDDYRNTGFLICRITIQMKTGGGTWVVVQTKDLRGKTPSNAGGGTGNPFDQNLNTTDSPTFVDLDLTGDASLLDGKKIILGTGNDLELFWDGANGWLSNLFTSGDIYVQSVRHIAMRLTHGFYIQDKDDGNVALLLLDTNGRTLTIGLAADPIDITQHGSYIMGGSGTDDEALQVPYLTAAPATLANGMIWMEADGLHIYYAGAEKLVAGV